MKTLGAGQKKKVSRELMLIDSSYLASFVVENLWVDLIVADKLGVVRFQRAVFHAHSVPGGQVVDVFPFLVVASVPNNEIELQYNQGKVLLQVIVCRVCN